MTDGGAVLQPDQEEPALPFRPRSEYADYEVFGSGPDAVFVFPRTARELRSAAEFATQERRIAGGLLFGRGWRDDEGPYLVISGYLAAGPGENRGDKIGPDGYDNFTLSPSDLRLLQEDAVRQYPSDLEVGWWRSLAAPGEFSPRDYLTQRDLIGPGGVGLLVFGSGLGWGDAYIGPDGHAPGLSDEPVVPAPRPEAQALPESKPGLVAVDLADPEPAVEVGPAAPAGPRDPVFTPAPQPTGPRVVSPVRVPSQDWGSKPANPGLVGPRMPTDVKLVVGALILAAIAVAIILGMLLSNVWVGLIALVVGLLVIFGFIYITHI